MNKWAPFQAVIDGEILIKNALNNKSQIVKPLLSEEQISELEMLIQDSYNNKINLEFTLYQKKQINHLVGMVVKINSLNQTLTLNNQKSINFSEIIRINYLD